MHGWQANKKRTCAQPVVLGLCPKLKSPPLCGGDYYLLKEFAFVDLVGAFQDTIEIDKGKEVPKTAKN